MRVFISWSGKKSADVADFIRAWLPMLVQSVEPWMSESDIEPGKRWSNELAEQLSSTDVGIICLTRANLSSAWMLFEAGALAKSTKHGVLIPLLVDIEKTEIPSPLGMYQATTLDREGLLSLAQAVSTADATSRLDQQVLINLYGRLWPAIEEDLQKRIPSISTDANLSRLIPTERDLLEELLAIVRGSASIGTKKDIVDVLTTWESKLRLQSERAWEAHEKYDAPTAAVSDRFDDFANNIAEAIKLILATPSMGA